MFGAHWYQLAAVLVVALLFFGPKRLPEMGSSIGKTIKEFQRSMKEVTQPTDDAPKFDALALPPPAPSADVQPRAGLASTFTTDDVDVDVDAEAATAGRQRE